MLSRRGGTERKGTKSSGKVEKKDVVNPGEGAGDETREDDDEGGGKRSKIDPDNAAEGVDVKLGSVEKKTIDFRGKLYLAR